MPIIGAFVLPHPPIILPAVGRGEEERIRKTIHAFQEIAGQIEKLKPDTIVLTSPHSVVYSDYFHISPGRDAKGDLRNFRASSVSVSASYDVELISKLIIRAEEMDIPAGTLGEREAALDHGTVIPLSFINERFSEYQLVRIGLSGMSLAVHYRFGMCIKDVAEKSGKKIVFIASGDLSHKVAEGGPYGFAPEGVQFDREITQAMAAGDFLKILSFSPELTEKAAECGLRSIAILAGSLDGMAVDSKLLSYEGTFGVGYGVASFIPKGEDQGRRFLNKYNELEHKRLSTVKDNEDEYVKLARYSVEHYVISGARAKLPYHLSESLTRNRAGVFVSLKKNGNLRGCIGTIAPTTDSIAEEILQNAVSACGEDPRFDPVQSAELSELVYSVDVLSPSEPITSPKELDVKRYGVIVTNGFRRGLLLPNLEGVDTVDQQIAIALQKAGIREGEQYSKERFEVVRHQ